MNSTVIDAVKNGPVVCLLGGDKSYVIGDVAYRFKNDHAPMASGYPVCWINGQWRDMWQSGYRTVSRGWNEIVTVLD